MSCYTCYILSFLVRTGCQNSHASEIEKGRSTKLKNKKFSLSSKQSPHIFFSSQISQKNINKKYYTWRNIFFNKIRCTKIRRKVLVNTIFFTSFQSFFLRKYNFEILDAHNQKYLFFILLVAPSHSKKVRNCALNIFRCITTSSYHLPLSRRITQSLGSRTKKKYAMSHLACRVEHK